MIIPLKSVIYMTAKLTRTYTLIDLNNNEIIIDTGSYIKVDRFRMVAVFNSIYFHIKKYDYELIKI